MEEEEERRLQQSTLLVERGMEDNNDGNDDDDDDCDKAIVVVVYCSCRVLQFTTKIINNYVDFQISQREKQSLGRAPYTSVSGGVLGRI